MRKILSFLIIVSLAIMPKASKAQNARTFTYDAAGNRIAMGVPVQQVRIQELNLLQHNDQCVK